MSTQRRDFLKAGGAALAAGLAGCAGMPGMPGAPAKARVVVVGGGYGGATAARYVRLLDPTIDVILVEPNESFVSCPISNMVLGGFKTMADITRPYSGLERRGVRVVRDSATAIDVEKKQVRLARGDAIGFERVIVSPGVDFMWEALPSMGTEAAQGEVLHAWKAGPQTLALRRQLEAMPDGGIYVLSVPEAPYRCPPGPYERACQVAAYFRERKPRSKVMRLDANADVTSKGPLFKKAWAELYKGIIEYRPNSKATDVDVGGRAV
jgi:NADPH-dependent 2,4-dienoyl-CoA reductase/sulfur reductase-like enzyme